MILCGLVGFLFTMGPASFENWLVWSLEVDGMKEAYWVCKPHSVPDVNVSRAMIAGAWVAFFQRVPAMIVRTQAYVFNGLDVHGVPRSDCQPHANTCRTNTCFSPDEHLAFGTAAWRLCSAARSFPGLGCACWRFQAQG